MNEPTVYHVDDDMLIRKAVALLARSVQMAHREFASVQSFFESKPPDGPGCVLTDLRMPGLSGMELLRRCSDYGVRMPVIVYTAYADVPVVVGAMKAGAYDFLLKPLSEQVLLERLQAGIQFDARRQAERAKHEATAARLMTLNPGQREVLDAMVRGTPYKVIATELGVSYKTVEARRAKVMEKMGSESLAELLCRVIEYRTWLSTCGYRETSAFR